MDKVAGLSENHERDIAFVAEVRENLRKDLQHGRRSPDDIALPKIIRRIEGAVGPMKGLDHTSFQGDVFAEVGLGSRGVYRSPIVPCVAVVATVRISLDATVVSAGDAFPPIVARSYFATGVTLVSAFSGC